MTAPAAFAGGGFPPLVALVDAIGLTQKELDEAVALAIAWQHDRLWPSHRVGADIAAVAKGAELPPAAWGQLYIRDHSDIEGALGYHDRLSKSGIPNGIVAYLDSGAGWLKTWLHELGELAVDPSADRCRIIGRRAFAEEIGDPVEDDDDPADPNYINLILPGFFEPDTEGKVDFLGRLPGPITADGTPPLTPGGYQLYLDLTEAGMLAGWQQIAGRRIAAAKAVPHPFSRRARRQRRHIIQHGIAL